MKISRMTVIKEVLVMVCVLQRPEALGQTDDSWQCIWSVLPKEAILSGWSWYPCSVLSPETMLMSMTHIDAGGQVDV